MELNTYARIGKAVISKAIGLQRNHTEIIIDGPDKIDEIKSGCYSCPHYQDKLDKLALGLPGADLLCKECSQAVLEHSYKTIYVNEKNKYGYRPTLKTYAIKLFMLYHFLQPDPLGLIKNIKIKDLADILGCTLQTIHNCNQTLVEYGYCYIGNTGWDDGHINVWLSEYKDYHKTAREGGRGYLTLSKTMFDSILTITSLNPLRLTIKGLLEIDNQANVTTDTQARTTYKKLRYFLPQYCKRNVIQKALEHDNPVFSIHLEKDAVIYKLPEKLGQAHLRKEMEHHSAEIIKNHIEQLNKLLVDQQQCHEYSTDDFHAILDTLSITPADTYEPIIIPSDAYNSLGAMCVQYSTAIVQSAIAIVYNNYINRGRIVDNFGALIRTTIRNMSVLKKAS